MHNRNVRPAQRAAASCRALSADDAAIVKGMLARGDRQYDIAAYFGVNAGRIAEISMGQKFADIRPADPASLPQPDYHLSVRNAIVPDVQQELRDLSKRIDRIERHINRSIQSTLQ
jgi:hypothetical protein